VIRAPGLLNEGGAGVDCFGRGASYSEMPARILASAPQKWLPLGRLTCVPVAPHQIPGWCAVEASLRRQLLASVCCQQRLRVDLAYFECTGVGPPSIRSPAELSSATYSSTNAGLPASSPDSVGDGAKGGGPDAEVVVDAVKHG
jgi:hypothetical protein